MIADITGVISPDPHATHDFISSIREDPSTRNRKIAHGVTRSLLNWAVAYEPHLSVSIARLADGSIAIVSGFDPGDVPHDEPKTANDILRLMCGRFGESWSEVTTEFSGFLFDASTDLCIVFRSRLGGPPIFITDSDGGTLWSTRLDETVNHTRRWRIDPVAAYSYMSNGFVTPPRSMIEGVEKLHSSRVYEITRSGRRAFSMKQPPWPDHRSPMPKLDPDSTQALLVDSIKKRLGRGGPTGVLLSAGVDSSLILALARKNLGADLRTFTFRYADYEGEWNEWSGAAETASFLGVPHEEVPLTPDFLVSNIDRLLQIYQEPFAYGLHTASITEPGLDVPSVMLTGAFGTTWFPSRAEASAFAVARYPWIEKPVRTGAEIAVRVVPPLGRKGKTLARLAFDTPSQVFRALEETTTTRDHVLARIYARSNSVNVLRSILGSELDGALEGVGGISQQDAVAHLAGLVKGPEENFYWNDRFVKAAGASPRHPYADFNLAAYLSNCRRPGDGKSIVREIAARVLPGSIANRKKIPQTVPLAQWIRGPLNDWFRSELEPDRIATLDMFDPTRVLELLEEHQGGAKDHKWALWGVLSMIRWWDGFRNR